MTQTPPLHLVKLCVGAESVADLVDWQKARSQERAARGVDPRPRHVTRMTPRRGAELLQGGSLYWVIKGVILARQGLHALDPVTGEDGINRCALVLDPEIIRTVPRPKRPFQGWRYLKPEDAPPDLTDGEAIPEDLRETLSGFGVL